MENTKIHFKMNAKDNCHIDETVTIGENVTIYQTHEP